MFLISLLKSFWSSYDNGSNNRNINDSYFRVMWLVLFEVQITTCMNRFPVHLYRQFRTPLHDQNGQDARVLWAHIYLMNFMVSLRLLRWWRNCCSLAGTCDQTTSYLRHLVGLWSDVSNDIYSKCSINMWALLNTANSEFPMPYPLFVDWTLPQTEVLNC
jgi:hypothetical protein